MNYRQLGAHGPRVSEIGIGAFPLSGMQTAPDGGVSGWTGTDDQQAIALIHRAQELGINLVDSAESYGSGHSEEVVGRALAGRRDSWVIATKVSTNRGLTSDKDDLPGAAKRHILAAAEDSLRRLSTDYIDVYQLHALPIAGTAAAVMEAMMELKAAAKIRMIGISSNDSAAIRELAALGEVDVLQVGYNLIERQGAATLDYATQHGVGTLIRVPLAKGMLTGKYFQRWEIPPEDLRHERFTRPETVAAFRKLPELSFLAREHDPGRRTMAQTALRFTLHHPGTSCVIAGAKTVAQIEENAAASSVAALSSDELRRAYAIVDGLQVPNWAGN